ncbi:hypothetical protein TCAL_17176 [Tigriopus californicus]|uniref:Apple domain-containing protein n=1 Tax=Tigriopus californicus TaxID=6832 RepID=A0A553N9C2_TIGCA|nr:hypothetical protein TCAL_17176 [Tigriopus californicus]
MNGGAMETNATDSELYSFERKSWEYRASPGPIRGTDAVTVNGTMYIFFGSNTNGDTVKEVKNLLSSNLVTGQIQLECFVEGACVNSNLVGEQSTTSAGDCADTCNQDANCAWFTYYEDFQVCTLLDGCKDREPMENTISGMKGCETRCSVPGICRGALISLDVAPQELDCSKDCFLAPNCTWYSFKRDSNLCHLFSTCPTLDLGCETCISGERDCFETEDDTESFVFLGLGSTETFEETDVVEVFNLKSPARVCSHLPSVPYNTSGSTGGFLDRVVYCGGFETKNVGTNGDTDKCYELESSNGTWTNRYNMSTPRQDAASVVLPNGTLWITGGFLGGQGYLHTSEVYDPNYGIKEGPLLPGRMSGHCLVQVDDESTFIIGGSKSTGDPRKVYEFYFNHYSYVEVAPMRYGRSEHACGLINDPTTGEKYILVAGGAMNGGAMETNATDSELYSFERKSWEYRASPGPIRGTDAVTVNGTMYIFFGSNTNGDTVKEVKKYDFTRDEWITVETNVEFPRQEAVIFSIPDSFCD